MPEKFPTGDIHRAAWRLLGNQSHDHEQSEVARRFWEQGWVKVAPQFKDQLRNADQDSSRANKIYAAPKAIVAEARYNEVPRSKVEFTEAEGLKDLHDYLQLVISTASQEDSQEAQTILAEAQEFGDRFSFMGSKEFDEAVTGIAQAWAAYLSQGPDYVMNVYSWSAEGRKHSYEVIAEKILARLQETLPPEVFARLHAQMDNWQETEHAKLVAIDDWMVTGITMKGRIEKAQQTAAKKGLAKLVSQAEIHLLIARKGQIGPAPESYQVRSFFETQAESSAYAVAPSGAHSSVDNGFEHVFNVFGDFLKARGILREPPLLAYLDRAYNSKIAGLSQQQLGMLQELAGLNKQVTELDNKRSSVKKRWKEAFDSHKRDEMLALGEEERALTYQIEGPIKRQMELADLLKEAIK